MSDTADQPPITATNDDTTMSPINTDTKGEAVDIQENALLVDSSTVPLDETNSTTLRETMNDNRSQPTLETGTIRRSGRVRKPTMQYIEAINTKQIVAETQDEQVDDEDKEQTKEEEEENDDEEDQMEEDDEDEDEDDNKVYCLCRKPDDGTVMINCDGCSEWYHAKCVGLTKSKVAKISTYYCPVCISTLPGVSGISSKGAMKPAFISTKGKSNDATTPANNSKDNTKMDTDTSSSSSSDNKCARPSCNNEIDGWTTFCSATCEHSPEVVQLKASGVQFPSRKHSIDDPATTSTSTSTSHRRRRLSQQDMEEQSVTKKQATHRVNPTATTGKQRISKKIRNYPKSADDEDYREENDTTMDVDNDDDDDDTDDEDESDNDVDQQQQQQQQLSTSQKTLPSRTGRLKQVKPPRIDTSVSTSSQHQRKHSASTPSSPDPLRRMVVNKLTDALKNILQEAGEKGKTDPSAVTDEDLRAHAEDIEEALFDYLADRSDRSNGPKCGQEYKSKFRSLIFGLNDKKNDSLRFGVLSGQVTSSVLVRMSNEDMANEELRNLAQDVREQGIRDSVIEDIDLSAYVKKTHKGEVMLGDTRPSADDDTRRITGSNNSSSGTRKTTTATTSSSSSSVSRRASESATSSMATTPITATFAESDRKRMDQHDNNDPLSKFDKVFDRFEALDSSKTSKNESDTTSASVAGSSSLDVKSPTIDSIYVTKPIATTTAATTATAAISTSDNTISRPISPLADFNVDHLELPDDFMASLPQEDEDEDKARDTNHASTLLNNNNHNTNNNDTLFHVDSRRQVKSTSYSSGGGGGNRSSGNSKEAPPLENHDPYADYDLEPVSLNYSTAASTATATATSTSTIAMDTIDDMTRDYSLSPSPYDHDIDDDAIAHIDADNDADATSPALSSLSSTSSVLLGKSQNGKVLPTIWQGRLFMPDVADLQCTASQVAGQSQLDRVAWDNLLPTALSVDGRIHVGRTDDYLRQIIQSSTSKQLLLVRFNPPHAKEHASAYQTLWSYFNTRHRYGVVGYTLSSVKDMYIVPISTTQAVLPSFMNLLDYRPDTASSNKHYLLGVIVWNQPKSTTAAAAASSSSSSTATSYHKQSGHRQRKPRSTTPPLPPPLPSTSSSLSIMTKNTANTAAAVTATATADSSNNGNLGTNGLLSPNTSVAQLLAQLNYPASTATATTTATSSLLNNGMMSTTAATTTANPPVMPPTTNTNTNTNTGQSIASTALHNGLSPALLQVLQSAIQNQSATAPPTAPSSVIDISSKSNNWNYNKSNDYTTTSYNPDYNYQPTTTSHYSTSSGSNNAPMTSTATNGSNTASYNSHYYPTEDEGQQHQSTSNTSYPHYNASQAPLNDYRSSTYNYEDDTSYSTASTSNQHRYGGGASSSHRGRGSSSSSNHSTNNNSGSSYRHHRHHYHSGSNSGSNHYGSHRSYHHRS